jgi:hypothetical protein
VFGTGLSTHSGSPSQSSLSSFTPHAHEEDDVTTLFPDEIDAIVHESGSYDPQEMPPDVKRHYLELHDELGKVDDLLMMDPAFDLDHDVFSFGVDNQFLFEYD